MVGIGVLNLGEKGMEISFSPFHLQFSREDRIAGQIADEKIGV